MPGPDPVDRLGRWPLPAAVGLVGLGTLLLGAAVPAWSVDESATLVILRRSGQRFWQAALLDNHGAIAPYYLLMKPWSAVSPDPVWLRLPTIVATAATAALLVWFLQQVAGRRVALLAGTTLLVLPATTWYAANIRPYALAMLAVTAGVVSWWRWCAHGRGPAGVLAWLAFTLAGLLHAFAVLVLGALLVTALVAPVARRRDDLRRTAMLGTAVAVTLAPFLWALRRAGGAQFIGPPPVTLRAVITVWERMTMAWVGPDRVAVVGAVVAVAALVGLGLAWVRSAARQRSLAVLGTAWMVLPPMTMIAMQAATGRPGLIARYWLISVPAVAIGIALLLAAARWRGVALLGVGLLVTATWQSHVDMRTPDGHGAGRFLALSAVMDLPGLATAPLLTDGYGQRALAANAPHLTGPRTPLNGDPAPTGLLSPVPYGPGTAQFSALVSQHDLVVAFQHRPFSSQRIATPTEFTESAAALETFSLMVVGCSFHGEALGVFAQPGVGPTRSGAEAIADRIEGLAPDRIRCRVP